MIFINALNVNTITCTIFNNALVENNKLSMSLDCNALRATRVRFDYPVIQVQDGGRVGSLSLVFKVYYLDLYFIGN